MKKLVDQKKRNLIESGQFDERRSFTDFVVYRRGNEIILLSENPSKDCLYEFETSTSAKKYFAKSVHVPYMVEVPNN